MTINNEQHEKDFEKWCPFNLYNDDKVIYGNLKQAYLAAWKKANSWWLSKVNFQRDIIESRNEEIQQLKDELKEEKARFKRTFKRFKKSLEERGLYRDENEEYRKSILAIKERQNDLLEHHYDLSEYYGNIVDRLSSELQKSKEDYEEQENFWVGKLNNMNEELLAEREVVDYINDKLDDYDIDHDEGIDRTIVLIKLARQRQKDRNNTVK